MTWPWGWRRPGSAASWSRPARASRPSPSRSPARPSTPGGSRPNVVADRAVMQVEVRAATTAAFDQAMDEVERIVGTSTVEGATATMSPAHRHPPMERTEAVAALVAEAQAVAHDLGFEVGDTATGGAGDANTTAATGLATIDGLAPVGGEAHGPDEWLDLDSVVPRTALLAGLLARLGSSA